MPPDNPLERLYPCCLDGGCGQSKPAAAFYKNVQNICARCADKLVLKTGCTYEEIANVVFLISDRKNLYEELKDQVVKIPFDVREECFTRYIAAWLRGARNNPTDFAFFESLNKTYRNWLVSYGTSDK
jgi:hypothetical protein